MQADAVSQDDWYLLSIDEHCLADCRLVACLIFFAALIEVRQQAPEHPCAVPSTLQK